MADLPQPQSYEQLLSSMLSAYASKVGISDYNVGGAAVSLLEVVALTTARSSGDLFSILRDYSVDRASGDALRRLAKENNVPLISASSATGAISVIDTSFVKISTKIYAGANPPNIGSTAIKVSDASAFTASGQVYLGRGTPNIEGPLPYSSITPSGSFYILNLTSPTTKFHNLGEDVILAQGGNRSVPANTVVLSPSTGSTTDIQYKTVSQAIILDGEIRVDNISIGAVIPGAAGNVPAGAIKEFASPPFSGAIVTNPLPLTTGADTETDEQLRIRIKRALASKGLGTATAIQSAVTGAKASDEQATIVSTSIVNSTAGSTLYIDDGSGYEAKSSGVGIESIVDSAVGGEQLFQLATGGRQAPVAKAFLQSTLTPPFDLIGGDTLAVVVGEITYQHVFATTDFRSPGGATAFEVTASVNANTALGFEATTSGGGTAVVLRAKTESKDSLQVTVPTTSGRDAAVQLGLPSNTIETLRLYKNNVPLNKDGNNASLFTQAQQSWLPSIANGDTLTVSVDGTDPITYTITNSDFIATGLYVSVSNTNSLESWVQVFNNKLTGITASIVGQQLELVSNLGANNRASLVIDPTSSLVLKGMFSTSIGLSSQGAASDFTLDRNTAQLTLATPLIAGDKLAAGSLETEARIETGVVTSGIISFTADAHVWLLTDSPGQIIQTGVTGNTLLSVSKPSTNILRFGSVVPNAFDNVQIGDYVVIWSEELPATDRIEGRVQAVTSSDLDILVTASEYASATVTAGVLYSDGFVVLRSSKAPQKFRVTSGTKTLSDIALELQAQTSGLIFTVFQDETIVVRSKTKKSTGSIFVVSADVQGKFMNFPLNSSDQSKDSLIAFYESGFTEASFPLFLHSLFSAGVFADPIDSFIPSIDSAISLAGRDPNELIAFLHPYGVALDSQAFGESVQEKSISGSTATIQDQSLLRRARVVDRYFIANPLDFGYGDTMVTILDNDAVSKSFEIPFFRKALTNTGVPSNTNNFNAYDVDSGPTANFSSAFGSSFDFSNFKVLMQAKKVLKHTPAETALLYRATKWGRSGEKISIGYVYPSIPSAPISSTVSVLDTVQIRINLKSGFSATSDIDATTGWDVSITPNTPIAGVDQVTYTWSGVGANPALTLVGGEYVHITSQTGFSSANTGIFRVSTEAGFAPTATDFTVQRANGAAVAETGKLTEITGAISFYNTDTTTAQDIADYVAASLGDYLTATVVDDGGTSGGGVIELSTEEDSNFAYDSVTLLDGINWLYSSNLGGSPNFIFKKALDLPTDVGYAFNDGEEIRFVPTTIDQVQRLLSILAVTGFTTAGSIGTAERSSKLELATQTLGSDGAIQVIGGAGNGYEVPVLGTSTRIDNSLFKVSVDKVSASGVHSDQWFKLSASDLQSKQAFLSSNSSVSVVGDFPAVGKTTVTLGGRTLNQRYFGKPRNHLRTRGATFRVEQQGSLVCLSWDGVGSSPVFQKSALNFNDVSGGTLNVNKVLSTSESEYTILTGAANFTELSIGDLVTVSGLTTGNNGTFLVTGVSDNGKILRVLNENSANEFNFGTFTFTGNSTTGDAFTIDTTTLVAATHFAIGGTQTDTAINLAAVISTIPGVSAVANGSVVTVTATSLNSSIPISYLGTAVITVSHPTLVGISFTAGDFMASSEISEGDQLVIGDPFLALNQGTFRVIRRYNDSVWFENSNMVQEEVTLPDNLINLGVSGTTSLDIVATNNSQYVKWNGAGTEPNLENALVGDVMRFGTDFAAVNRGNFMVLRSGVKLPQITELSAIAGTSFTLGGAGKYFTINSAGNVNQYYVWFNVNSSNSDPAPGGLTAIPVAILSGDSADQVAVKIATQVGAATGLDATSSGNVVTVTTTDFIETTIAANVNVPAPFAANTVQLGRRTFVECINPSAANNPSVTIADVLECHRPQINAWEYDASIPGDQLVIAGDILTLPNAGTYPIEQVLNRDTVIIGTTLASYGPASLNGRETAVYVEEALAYTGYKQALLVSGQPGAPTRNLIVFNTNDQYEKINEAAGVQIESLNKLGFNTALRKGLDSYRYNTGLISEANRIVYGDPRDVVTYPGTGAAGADIFIREPLTRRIQLSIDIRLNTGVPFNQMVEQVRTSVSSLINSNSIGTSIAISSIISVINAISGVKAVAISSPQYDSTHDLIFIAPNEKAKIIDPTLDIAVSGIG